jgi:hypothetical protein
VRCTIYSQSRRADPPQQLMRVGHHCGDGEGMGSDSAESLRWCASSAQEPRSLVGLAGVFHELFNSNRQTDPFAHSDAQAQALCCADDLLTFYSNYFIHDEQATGRKKGKERDRLQKYMF